MRRLILFALLISPAYAAQPSSWAVICTAPCIAQDGTTQPAGTVVQKIWWDGVSNWTPPANAQVVPDTGQTLYTPPPVAPTTIDSLDFINRFTTAEQTALMAADPLWGVQIAAAGMITVTNPQLLTEMQAAVAAGALTKARMTQVLNLAVTSP